MDRFSNQILMKRKLWAVLCMFALMSAQLFTSSCSKDDKDDTFLEVAPEMINMDASGVAVLNISSNVSWTVSTTASWLTFSTLSGTGNGQVVITATGNVTDRSAIVTVKAEGVTRQVAVTQSANGTPTTPTDPTTNKGTLSNPYTVSEAAKIANALNAGEVTGYCYVKGVVKSIAVLSTTFGWGGFYIADTSSDNVTLFANECRYLQEKDFTSEDQIAVGDNVVIYGKLTKNHLSWGDRPEIVEDYIYSLNGETQPSGWGTWSETASSDGSQITYTINGVSFKMIRVDGGAFQMGATSEQGISTEITNEKPVHSVTLSTYYICETEVTQGLWYAIMGQKPSSDKEWMGWGLGSDYPAYYISWDMAQEFISKLNDVTGRKFRLPTEAEWEFAARGGTKSKGYKYAGSNTIGDVAWYEVNPAEQTHPVATKKANELGLYDMSGNVREWCSDWYDYFYYKDSPVSNPTGPSTGESRVMRGGSIGEDEDACRVSCRGSRAPTSDTYPNGMRLALKH